MLLKIAVSELVIIKLIHKFVERLPDSEQYSKSSGRKCLTQPVREWQRSIDMLLMKQDM